MGYNFKKAIFYKCLGTHHDLETLKLPHSIKLQGAIVGRSNVGKSSLINHFLQNKQLAKVSSTPGKTQTINAYLIDNDLILMDLPGYGFAKRAKNAQQQWSSLIQKYFDLMRPHFIFILLDIRIPPTEDDFTMIRWAQSFNIPIIVILTKADKIAPSKLKSIEMELIEMIQNETNLSSFSHLCYSIKQPKARQQLIALINQFE